MLTTWPWQHWARQRPDQPALHGEEERYTWRQLTAELDRRAAHYQAQGVQAGCGVALRGKNSLALLLDYLALIQCGARVLVLNPQLPAALLARLLPGLTLAFLREHAEPVTCDVPPLYPPVQALPPGGCAPVAFVPSRLATLTLTSGSSGLPKAAAHSIAAHLASAAGVLALIPFPADACWLLSLPLFHVSGQGIVWRWLRAGAALAVRPQLPLAEALAGCTHASLVPTQLWRLLEQGCVPGTLRAVLLGGAAIPTALTSRAEQAGIRCWCGYGMTEMASTVCAKRADAQPGVGQPLAGCEIKVVKEEVLIRAPGQAAGYWRDGVLHPLADNEGWYHSRDRGVMEAGELRILGRLDNLFFSGGEGIQPEEIERILARHPQVTQVFVVPVEDVQFGQRPVAVLETTGTLQPEALTHWLAGQVPRFQWPVAYYSLPESLKQGGIKIPRHQVQQWVASQP
ncbi:o-succinylbenzoate--CoA ligase [Chimaeribacter californicus]|uniref:O-succinylbenzoate--CoA ligase n=2 Tax=Chimaeribacter californicus TaxID=2060067 RepID=A0A2N5EEB8_9GAMM|nr:o-succinylbenzoate--CoA ligase [Chimaeribacter californicus]PLR40856.1 o-succinylbenzoate--CoA ligase [Chimaeribacter californicus]